MEVEFIQTTTDYYNAYKHICRRLNASTKWRYLATLSGVAFGVLFTIGLISIGKYYEKYSYLDSQELNNGLSAIAIGTIILIIGLKIYNMKVRPLIFEEKGLYLSPQKFKIEKDSLLQYLGENQYRYLWKYVKEVEKTSDYIFVFLDRGAALYIPRHAFESNEKYVSFCMELLAHAQQNR